MEKKWTGERLESFVYNESTIEHLHRYAIAMDYAKGKTVLDIACGEGYGANLLATQAKFITGIDKDSIIIRNASEKYGKPNLIFKEGQVDNIPESDNSFDIVVSFETLEHTMEHEKMFVEIKRVLKPEGLLIISTPEKKNYSDLTGYMNPFHVKELYESSFIELIRSFFNYDHCMYQTLALTSIALAQTESETRIYEGNYESVIAKNKIDPVYLIAIASDKEIKKPKSSIFLGTSILQTALKEKEKELKNTLSYKIGHFLLIPAKWIRNVFRK